MLRLAVDAPKTSPRSGCSIAKWAARPLTAGVQFDFFRQLIGKPSTVEECLLIGSKPVPVHLARNSRARRYILRVKSNGIVRVTIPAFGSKKAALEFARRQVEWITKQLEQRRQQPTRAREWHDGTTILFRGEPAVLTLRECLPANEIHFADQKIVVPGITGDLRPLVERHLQQLAAPELAARTLELAASQGLEVRRVTVRDQRSRWGSCSARRTVSLNWRLIQVPPFVRDYIILHELMHLREMNHSDRFWNRVEQVCPDYKAAEDWLRQHQDLLREG